MINCKLSAFVFSMFLLFTACSKNPNIDAYATLQGATIQIVIDHKQAADHPNQGTAFVYGRILIFSDKPIKTVNLECISIAIGELKASKLSIDSIAYIFPNNYPSNDSGNIDVPVYWIFPNTNPKELASNNVSIVTDDSNSHCIVYQ